jgi:hypothetical protein
VIVDYLIKDETVNPKRPLRPSRLQQNSTSSGLNSPNSQQSNQNSRPMSHLSGLVDNTNFSSITNLLNIQDIHIQDDDDALDRSQVDVNTDKKEPLLFAPPPKPPKLIKIRSTPTTSPTRYGSNGHHSNGFNGHESSNTNGKCHLSFSSEDLMNQAETSQPDIIISAQSSASLNSMQFRFLTKKTASADLGLNKVGFECLLLLSVYKFQ